MLKKILFDADVLIHFSKGNALDALVHLYPNRMCVLEQVLQELRPGTVARSWVDAQIAAGQIEHLHLPQESDIILEYARLISRMGSGESACLVLARFDGRFLASSNLRDIQSYCGQHSIGYVTTMDVIHQLEKNGLWTEAECDTFITTVKQLGSRLPVKSLIEYRKRFRPREI
ncbi:MAG: hypothetical protein NWR72_00150 [Bacteroidia bacterium]|nr:hypothetical protein [Bacteroidia bacterium]